MTATIPTYGDLSDYSLGKFQKNVDQLAWAASLDMPEEEEGTTEYNGHIALVTLYGAKYPTANEVAQYEMTSEDVAFLAAQDSAIVETHPSGAVYVEWFTDGNAAQARFNAIRSDYATPEDWEY